jgi:cytochrome c553
MASRRPLRNSWRRLAGGRAAVLPLALAGCLIAARDAAAQTLQDRIAACVGCHGERGLSPDPNVPAIGGQPKLFVMYQLFFYRDGRRASPEMNAIAKGLSDADLAALASYVAGLPPPPPAEGPVDRARYERGAEVARQRMCGSCHNPDYSGREQMPRLAGQREGYLLKAFKDYQAGARVGTQAAMAEAMRGLDDAALADLAYYLARFRP